MAVNIDGDTGVDKIQPGTIDSADFGPGSVTTPTIADSAVTAPKVAGADGSAGQYLQSDGDGTMSWITAAAGGFSNIEVFNSPGTWTNPGNVEKVKVTVVGGGGGGSGPTPINAGQTLSAGSGGTSSFGAYCSATGGDGAVQIRSPQGVSAAGASGGIGSGGSFNVRGGSGGQRYRDYDSASGGNSLVGAGAFSANRYNGGANSASASAGGGGIGNPPSSQVSGGGGGGAAVEVIPFPTGTNVPVTIGAAGNTLGSAIAAGSGIVIVEY